MSRGILPRIVVGAFFIYADYLTFAILGGVISLLTPALGLLWSILAGALGLNVLVWYSVVRHAIRTKVNFAVLVYYDPDAADECGSAAKGHPGRVV